MRISINTVSTPLVAVTYTRDDSIMYLSMSLSGLDGAIASAGRLALQYEVQMKDMEVSSPLRSSTVPS